MKLVILSVKDLAAQVFARPMFLPSTGVGLRSFTDEVNRADKDNTLFSHPSDFELYNLGTFDDQTGRFDLLDDPVLLTRGVEVQIPLT